MRLDTTLALRHSAQHLRHTVAYVVTDEEFDHARRQQYTNRWQDQVPYVSLPYGGHQEMLYRADHLLEYEGG